MNPPASIRLSIRGTVVIFALLVVLVGAVVLAGWATMMATRSLFPDAAIEAQKRRIAMENGRALARGYLFGGLTNGTIAATNISLTGGCGGFTVAAASINILSNTTPPSAYNPFSPGERSGFEQTIAGSITTASETNSWSFRIRGRSPIYAGYPLVMHLPADSVPSSVDTPSALLWTNSPAMDFSSTNYQSSTNLSALSGGGANISPFPYVPLAMESPAGSLSYSGQVQSTPISSGAITVTDDPLNGITVTSNATTQTVTIDLGVVNLTSAATIPGSVLLRYNINASSGNGTRILVLNGDAAASSLPPLLIVYEAGANDLTTINLVGNNQRRTYLSISKNTPVTINTSGSAAWRMGMLLQGSASTWSLAGTLTMTGGIRSNANISASGGSIHLQADVDPGGLDSLADRMVWLEENRTE
jgi:hypothetical protein